MASNELVVRLVGDTKSLDRALSRASRTAPTKMQRISKAAGALGIALGVGLAAAAKVGFDEMSESAKVMAQTEAVLKSTGNAANVTAEHVADMATELSRMSGIDDELIQSGENLLLTFKNIRNGAEEDEKFFDQATRAALDLSVALGKDLNSSALMVGKALNDPVKGLTALGRAGVQFTEKQRKLIKSLVESGNIMDAQEIILAELESQVGGSAKAYGETLPGKIAKARIAFEEMTGAIMLAFLPAMLKITDLATKFSEWMEKNPKQAKLVIAGIVALTAALVAASVAQTALNLAVLANPYVAAVAGTVALAAGIAFLIKKVEFFRRHWQLLLIVVGAGPVLIATVVKAIIRHFDTLKAAFNKVKTVAQVAFRGVAVAIRVALGPILVLIGAAQRLIDLLGRIPGLQRAIQGGNNGGPIIGRGARPGRMNPNRGSQSLDSIPGTLAPRRSQNTRGLVQVNLQVGSRALASTIVDLDREHRRANGGRGLLPT